MVNRSLRVSLQGLEQVKKLHFQMAHPPKANLVKMIKTAGLWEDSTEELVDKVYEECKFKDCRARVGMEEWYAKGFPAIGTLVTDNALEFVAGEIVEFTQNFNVKQRVGAASTLQFNRQCE